MKTEKEQIEELKMISNNLLHFMRIALQNVKENRDMVRTVNWLTETIKESEEALSKYHHE